MGYSFVSLVKRQPSFNRLQIVPRTRGERRGVDSDRQDADNWASNRSRIAVKGYHANRSEYKFSINDNSRGLFLIRILI